MLTNGQSQGLQLPQGQQQQQQQQLTPSTRPPPRKRNRQALSCTACRERKIKCDRTVPCSQCVKRGDQQFCKIEQKPKIVHDTSAKKKQSSTDSQPHAEDQTSQRAMSPASLAYSQFSEALTAANGIYSSTSPPPAEVEAIKARLAMLESVLQGQMPSSTASASPQNASTTSPGSTSWLHRSSTGSSPVSGFSAIGPGHRSSTMSNGTFSHSPSSLQRDASDSEEEYQRTFGQADVKASQSPHQEAMPASSNSHDLFRMPKSRKGLDSDTEDAVVVLEKLAMSGGSAPKAAGTEQCPNAQSSASAQDGSNAFERCLQKDKASDIMLETTDAVNAEPTGTQFERCLQKDKTSGIMTEEEAAETGAMFERCMEIESKRGAPVVTESIPLPTTLAGTMDSTMADSPFSHLVAQSAVPSIGLPDQGQGPVNAGIGGPECACGPNCKPSDKSPGAASSPHIHSPSTGTAHVKHRGSTAEDNPLCTPVNTACRMACANTGLLRLKSGPETLLGWGMGWAWATADMLLQEDVKKAEKENRKLIVTEKTEREAVLKAICLSLPPKEIANQLIEVYESRVRYLCGHVVHIPCLRREVEAFYALDSVDKQARVVNHVDPGWLAMFLTILALGLRFYPCQPKNGWVSVKHLFDGKTIHAWHSAAKTCLVLANFLNSSSMSVLQTILLLYLYNSGQGSSCGGETDAGSTNTVLIRIALTNAQEMGLHRLGDFDKKPSPDEPTAKVIGCEIAQRVWWALVLRDWSAAGSGCTKDYFINPEHFNTPYPGNYNDEDLMTSPLPPPRPREEFTEMSYVISSIEFSVVIREDFDIRQRREMIAATNGGDRRPTCVETRKLDQMYRAVLEQAPSFFKVGSEIGRVTCIEVQRWLLQQGVFSKLLRIHRPNLSSREESRANCVLLARSILDMQKKIRSRCTVIDRLWMNLMQSFSAAIVLALHLLHTRPQQDHRLSVRSEITEAIDALKQIDGNSCTAKKCIRVIEALLAEEEERWKAGNDALAASHSKEPSAEALMDQSKQHKRKRQLETATSGGEEGNSSGRRKNLYSLAQRVAMATRGDESRALAQMLPQDAQSKRLATQASFGNPTFTMENNGQVWNTANAFNMPLSSGPIKDDASRMLMNNMTLPVPQPSPLPAADGSDVQFPVMANFQQQPVFDFSNLGFPQPDAPTRAAPPNGLDLTLNNPITPPDGQSFDLAAFLEQCDSSPGSSSDGSIPPGQELFDTTPGGHSSRGTSTGAPSENGAKLSPESEKEPEPVTSMDSFWNWILAQGANGIAPAPPAQQQETAVNPSLYTGLTPFLGPANSTASAYFPTPASTTLAAAVPIFQPGTPSKDVGTPSTGVDTFNAAAPLYDFTDYANAWTASNPNAAAQPSTGRGPISDP